MADPYKQLIIGGKGDEMTTKLKERHAKQTKKYKAWVASMKKLGYTVDATRTAYKDEGGELIEVQSYEQHQAGQRLPSKPSGSKFNPNIDLDAPKTTNYEQEKNFGKYTGGLSFKDRQVPKGEIRGLPALDTPFAKKYTPVELKKDLGPTKATDPQKGTDQVNVGSGKFATWYPGNEKNQALQIAAAEKNKTTTPTTSASKLKISSDVHTIDPETGEPVGVITRSQRRAFEAREDVQKQLLAAQKNKTDLRIYKDRLGEKVIRTSGG